MSGKRKKKALSFFFVFLKYTNLNSAQFLFGAEVISKIVTGYLEPMEADVREKKTSLHKTRLIKGLTGWKDIRMIGFMVH